MCLHDRRRTEPSLHTQDLLSSACNMRQIAKR